MIYVDRVIDAELQQRLATSGAVVIEGPKACGKTETAKQFARSSVFLDTDDNARRAASLAPDLVLDGETPRLIDEWQTEPRIWNHIRRAVDERRGAGHFILTGSAIPADDAIRHSGAGRISRIFMRPMSLLETGHSSGAFSLSDTLDGNATAGRGLDLDVPSIAERIAVGGWPRHLELSVADAIRSNRDYVNEIRRTDVRQVDQTRRDPDRVARLLRSLARNVATSASGNTLARDAGGADGPLHKDTVSDYLNALRRLMVVEDQPAWSTHLRSSTALQKAAKRHFIDPSLAVAALRGTPESLLDDLNFLGFLFESLAVRDLRVYAQAADAEVFHYRDEKGLEVDAIVEDGLGRWIACEVKLGAGLVDDGAMSLLKLAKKVTDKRRAKLAALVVVTVGQYSFQREDGVWVVPITALGP